MSTAPGIHNYAVEQLNQLLSTLALQIQRAAKRPGPDEIHDLRVSIRRFTQGLRLFVDFLPESEAQKIHGMLRRMMRLTSDIRNRDIALEFLAKSRVPGQRPRLRKERSGYQRQFSKMVQRWSATDFSTKWRNGLSLSAV